MTPAISPALYAATVETMWLMDQIKKLERHGKGASKRAKSLRGLLELAREAVRAQGGEQ